MNYQNSQSKYGKLWNAIKTHTKMGLGSTKRRSLYVLKVIIIITLLLSVKTYSFPHKNDMYLNKDLAKKYGNMQS